MHFYEPYESYNKKASRFQPTELNGASAYLFTCEWRQTNL